MHFEVGEIVLAWIQDPDNQDCDDPHPALVFKSEPKATNMWVIGISSASQTPIPWYWLQVHNSHDKDEKTGLYLPCWLKAHWAKSVTEDDVVSRMGHLDPALHERAEMLVFQVIERKKRGEPL